MNRKFLNSSRNFTGICAVAVAATILSASPAFGQRMEPQKADGVEATPHLELKNDQLAARFLDQATAGATPEEVTALSAKLAAHPNTAFAEWINDQFAKPAAPEDFSLTILRATYDNKTLDTSYRKHHPDAQAMRAGQMISDNNNELRRLVAYELGQIFVISDQDNQQLGSEAQGLCDWYDMLYRDAFTNFSTILDDVTYHPVMTDFLSSEGNAKAGFFNKDSRPDENYAREVMQLFTIGLLQLNMDGSVVTDAQGHAIPTYTQPEITEVARVFTGLKYPQGMGMTRGKNNGQGDNAPLKEKKGNVMFGRCNIDERRHDDGEKKFLGATIPSGQGAAKDIADTLALLCNHQNAAPFFAKGLIQRMVTSNPSAAYVKRVAQAFKSSNGDMKTVITAILLDEEARNPQYAKLDTYGKLREPWLRVTQLARGFHAQPAATQPLYPVYGKDMVNRLAQFPLSAPSVFNFYLPNYEPPGLVTERNANANDGTTLVVAPEFQIVNSNSALTTPNYLMDVIESDPAKPRSKGKLFPLDLTPQIGLAKDPATLVDNVSMLLTGGTMSDRSRQIITEAVDKLTPASDPEILKQRAQTAIYLTVISPDYAVQK